MKACTTTGKELTVSRSERRKKKASSTKNHGIDLPGSPGRLLFNGMEFTEAALLLNLYSQCKARTREVRSRLFIIVSPKLISIGVKDVDDEEVSGTVVKSLDW